MLDKFKIDLFVEKVPPGFAEIFGYRGISRWAALFWDVQSRFYQYFDGERNGPINQTAWDCFFNHPLIISMNYKREKGYTRKRFEIGPHFNGPPQWLLLDCREMRLYVGPRIEVLKFLSIFRDQYTVAKTTGMHGQSVEGSRYEGCQGFYNGGGIQMIHDMVSWLDRRLLKLKSQGEWPRIGESDDL